MRHIVFVIYEQDILRQIKKVEIFNYNFIFNIFVNG